MNAIARKQELQNVLEQDLAGRINKPLLFVDEDTMLKLFNGMVTQGAIEMYNIVNSGNDTALDEALSDEDVIDGELELLDAKPDYSYTEVSTSDKINAYKAILQGAKYINDSVSRKKETDLENALNRLDFHNDLLLQ